MKEQILKAFYHKGRKAFVPWLASELATRTNQDQDAVLSALRGFAYEGFANAYKVDGHKGLSVWALTSLGKSKAKEIMRAEEIARAGR